MGFRNLDLAEINLVLEKERVIRIAFQHEDEHFLVPVFYIWFDGALCGLTTPGRKTRLGEANASVAFQVDSTFETGPWEWASVSGAGTFARVTEGKDYGPFAAQLSAKLSDAPPWAQEQLQARFAQLGLYAWRITPTELSGRAHSRDET